MATTDEPIDTVPPAEEPVEEPVQDGDVRPSVKKYAKLEFRVGDVVYYLNDYGEKEGPYMVATVSGGKCTLCDLHGAPAKGSRPVSLSSLEPQKRRR